MHSFDSSLGLRDVLERTRDQIRCHGHPRGPEGQCRVHQDGRLRLSGEGRVQQQQLRKRRPDCQHRKEIQCRR